MKQEEQPQSNRPAGTREPAVTHPHPWRRRLVITGLVVVALAVISRLAIIVAFPPVIRHVAAHYGLNAQYERMELYLLNGDVGIWHFSLTPTEGGDPLVQADYTRCHISTFDLFRGRLTVRRLESEGIDLLAERKADGEIPLLDRIAKWKSEGAASPLTVAGANSSEPPAEGRGLPRKIDLTSPLEVDAFRLTSVHTHVVDNFVNPPVDMHVDLNLRLTDVDSPIRPTHFEMDLTASPMLDLLHVEGTGTASGAALDAMVHIRADGLHPQPGVGYLLPLGVRPVSNDIDLEMDAKIRTLPVAGIPTAIAAKLGLSNIRVMADSAEVARLDKLDANIDAIDLSMAAINQVVVQGGRCGLVRDRQGEIGVAGLQVMKPAVLEEHLAVPLTALINMIPQHWGIGELVLRDMEASLHDEAIAGAGAADLKGRIEEIRINNFSVDHPDAITTIHGRLSAPGIARSVRMDGQLRPHSTRKDVDLAIVAEGIRLDALKPYLDPVGIASDYSDGAFSADFHADVTPGTGGILMTNARLSKVVLKDKQQILALDEAALNQAEWNPDRGLLHIKSIELSGPAIEARRQANGSVTTLGFHTQPRPEIPAATITAAGGAEAQPKEIVKYVYSIPKIQVDQFVWKDVKLRFDDLAVTPNTSVATTDAGVELDNLALDFDPSDQPIPPAKLRAWLTAPDLAQSLNTVGTFTPRDYGISADLVMDGAGITSDGLAGYFQNSRIQPTLRDGSLHLATRLSVTIAPGVVRANLLVNDLAYKQGADDLLAVSSAEVAGLTARSDGLSIGRIAIQSPKVSASRDPDGTLHFGGVKLVPIPPQAHTGDRLSQIYQDRTGVAAPVAGAMKELEFTAALKELDVKEASLQWNDREVSPEASAHLTASVNVADLVLGKSAGPAKINVSMREDHSLDGLTMTGTVTPSLSAPAAQLQIDAAGIRAGTLSSYTGPALRVNLQNGTFSAAVNASTTINPAGGVGARLLVDKLDYRDGDSVLCQLDELRLFASRIDPAGKVFAFDEVGVDGVRSGAVLGKDGTIRLLGVTLSATPASKASEAPVIAASTAPAGDAKAVGIANLAALANQKHPFFSLAKLDIGVRNLSVSDEARPDAAPLALADAKLVNDRPIELLGENPESHPPVDLELTGTVNPLVKSVSVHAIVTPFDQQAGANIDVELSGIRGEGVSELIPGIKPYFDGSSLTDGRFKAQLRAQIRQPRSDPLDLDLTKDFAADVSLKGVEFRDGGSGADGGTLLAGVGEVTSDDIRVEPRQFTVIGRDLLVSNMAASVVRDSTGIHVLGCTLKPALWEKPPLLTGSATTAPSEGKASSPTPAGEIALGKFVANGLTLNVQDRLCDPPLVVPLSGMDVEARDLSTRMLTEDKSCRFSIIINAGKVTLPARNPTRGQSLTEERDLFSQVEAGGILSLYPKPKGWVKSSVSSLDLAALSGEAKRLGFTLNGGTFDANSDLRLNGDGTMRAKAKFSLTDLDVSEPPNGPVMGFLNINAPLNIAVAAVQDQDGSITIPVDVPIESGRISGPQITLAVTGAVASVVTTAIASTPLKAADAVMGMFGNTKPAKNDEPVTLSFAPGDRSIGLSGAMAIQGLLARMKDDPTLELTIHQTLSAGDVPRARELANPSLEDCRDFAERLRLKKIELMDARQAAAQRAQAELASGYGPDADASVEQLREIDGAIATTETAMDQMYDMLRPGAERQADRRTRAACLQIAQDRIDGVRDMLRAAGIPGIGSRIKTTHATYNVGPGGAGESGGGGTVTITLAHRKIQ